MVDTVPFISMLLIDFIDVLERVTEIMTFKI